MAQLKSLVLTTAFIAGFAVAMPTAFSAGNGTNDSSDNDEDKPNITCPADKKPKKKKVDGKWKWVCVAKNAQLERDEQLYDQGYKLAKAGDYEEAIKILKSVSDQEDPDVLNMIGYSHRKAGRLETAIAYYEKALEINPDFLLAREYLGEGFVAAGRIDLAQVQLNEIRARCGETCEEYKDLAKAIAAAQNG